MEKLLHEALDALRSDSAEERARVVARLEAYLGAGTYTPNRDALESFLVDTGWAAESTGPAGTLWRSPVSDNRVAVTKEFDTSSWRSTLERVARDSGMDPLELALELS